MYSWDFLHIQQVPRSLTAHKNIINTMKGKKESSMNHLKVLI